MPLVVVPAMRQEMLELGDAEPPSQLLGSPKHRSIIILKRVGYTGNSVQSAQTR